MSFSLYWSFYKVVTHNCGYKLRLKKLAGIFLYFYTQISYTLLGRYFLMLNVLLIRTVRKLFREYVLCSGCIVK